MSKRIIFCFSYPKTAPQSVEGQVGLGSVMMPKTTTTADPLRSFSAPTVNKPPRPGSSDSSENRSGASSSLSGLTSASDIQRGSPAPGTHAPPNTNKGPLLPTEMVHPLELLSDTGKEPRPPSAPRPPSQGARPGSEKHKVLPPISPKNARPVELQ
jgi:hypothetical protein